MTALQQSHDTAATDTSSHAIAPRAKLGALPVTLVSLAFIAALGLTAFNFAAIVPPSQWVNAIFTPSPHAIEQLVAHDSWLPRLIVAWLAGALLGLTGTVFQQVLRNPLAEPTTLGVSAGAQLALTTATLWAPAWLAGMPQWIALAGALAAALAVLALAWRSELAPVTTAVAGLVVTLYCGSFGIALQMFHAPYLRGMFIWGGGSLAQNDWHAVTLLAWWLVGGALLCCVLLRPLTLFSLDDTNARGLGLSLRRTRVAALMLAVVLSAIVVSAVGVIGFIGLVAPALARLAGARRLAQRVWVAPLFGALLLWLTDQAVQPLSGALGDLIPAGAASALFGAPLMLVLLMRMRRAHWPDTRTEVFAHALRDVNLPRRFVLLTLLCVLAFALALDAGRGAQGWHLLSSDALQGVLRWRAPRAIAALSAGVMLAVAGTLMQRLTGNPLASPELTGVSAGAALGMIALLLAAPAAGHALRLSATAAGAFGTLLAILWFARRSAFAADRVLLAGIAIGALFQAVSGIVIACGGDRAVVLLSWLAGSTYSITSDDALHAVALCVVLCALTPFTARWLTVLPLGEPVARALGVDTRHARPLLFLLIALHTAAATLIVGPLSFVGLTAPHFARLAGARRPLAQIALAAPIGALMMVVADWLGRELLLPRELPAGLVATLIGAPWLMWLLARRR
ncbi:Fe(3+)-hydroxamate ABC transporter permease FhuB [Paraburkholderia sp. C35]|uniref:Fe(3+)-hydroxamate ABC transporter permease FhuB n=1 Tax=Paraburkholderia sp. C35 TaxID=2126993 RepID=UPI000D697A74|nr:Fe(3+)-hydroxamate ABC transporter permease FhuB [Paraburkholderia sp. C35]